MRCTVRNRCLHGHWLFLRLWVALGIVAFLALVAVSFLIVVKPT
jgi:O-antigen ligase